MIADMARKTLASALTISIVLATPGSQAYAQNMTQAPRTGGQAAGLPASAVPVRVQFQGMSFQPGALKTGAALPTVSLPGVSQALVKPQAVQAVPIQASRIFKPLVSQAQNAEKPYGLLKAVVQGVSSQEGEAAPAAAEKNEAIKPSAETLQNEGSSREWAQKSFDELKDGVSAAPAVSARSVGAAEAADLLSKGGRTSVYSYETGSFQAVDGRSLVEAVRAGRYLAAADAEGRIALTPAPALAEAPQAAAETPAPQVSGKNIEEDFLGWRRVRGAKHDPDLKNLPAGADEARIIEQISRQFGIQHAKVVEMGERYRIQGRAAWLAVYDRLQKANRDEFSHLDSKKYEGGLLSEAVGMLLVKLGLKKKAETPAWRELTNKSYAPGLKGTLQRALEVHKLVLGALVRFPYHLFDQFLFGYFRRNISFEFFHGAEDFFAVRDALEKKRIAEEGGWSEQKPSAERWLEAAMSRSHLQEATALDKLRATTAGRLALRWLIHPLLQPLAQFVWRRATMALFSAAAMGLVSGLLPIPLLAIHLTALPVLGPALVGLQHALPALALHLPFVGSAASAILGHGLNALIGDLSVGPLLNSLVLSTAMTFPSVLRQRFMDGRHGTLSPPRALSALWWRGVVGTFFSPKFWWENLKSLLGLMTVGAEIEGVMTYAGALDAAFTPAFKAATGREFSLFHTVAAAVERPEGQSPIPFGGAITWGNILLYKLQDLLGFNLTDAVYRLTRGVVSGLQHDPVLDAVEAGGAGGAHAGASGVAAVIGALTQRSDPDRGFQAGTAAQMKDRAEAARRGAGEIEREMREVRERIRGLEAQSALQRGRLDALRSQSDPVSAAERARYAELLQALQEGRDEQTLRAKMAEIRDLSAGRPEEARRLESLKRLEAFYDASLLPQTKDPGRAGDLAVKEASLKALQNVLDGLSGERPEYRPRQGTAARVDAETEKRVAELAGKIEDLRGQAKAELANREALAKLLSALNTSRNAALRERRNGKDLLEFHKNMARLATVMDLAFSLNEIAAAQKALADMQALLDRKLEKIDAVRRDSAARQGEAERQRRNVDAWKKDVEKGVQSDQVSMKDMLDLQEQTSLAIERIGSFRGDVRSLLARIDAEDSGSSPNALAEYRRRQALLPTLVEWAKNGKPGDKDALSLKRFNDSIADADGYLRKIDDGLKKLDQAPVEFAGILVLAVPGVPDVSVVNPSAETTLRILSERETYWKGQKADYEKMVAEVRNRLDPSYAGTETDDFGEVRPTSLPRWLSQERENAARRQEEARSVLVEIDKMAAEINAAVPGANLPVLSGLELKALQDAVEAYPDKLTSVNFPNSDAPEMFRAKMALLGIGRLLPQAGRSVVQWTKADATVTTLQNVVSSTLPRVQSALEGIVTLMDGILRDVDADRAYVQAGGHSSAENAALIERKRAMLVREMRPRIEAAKSMVQDALIPFINDQIRGSDPEGDSYAKLFKAQIKIYEATKKAADRTLPWALASNGAPDGDKATGLSNIEANRRKYTRYVTGYDDALGHHNGIDELITEVSNRKDPNFNGTEDLYGEVQPFSLPKKIAQYSGERAQRAQQFNARAAEINAVLGRIDSMTGGKHNLSALRLPTGADPESQASADALKRLVDDGTLYALGDKLTELGNQYKAQGQSVSMGGGSGTTVPTGTQPSPTVDDATQVALLCLETAKRLAPSTNQAPGSDDASASYALARFLYSNAVVQAARKNLEERIPTAERFLAQAKTALQHALSDLDADQTYVGSDGASESGDAVVDRKLAVFRELNGVTSAGVGFFRQKTGWDQEGTDTVALVDTYYDATSKLYGSSGSVSDAERDAILKMKDALKKTFDDLEANRTKLTGWMQQLNDPHESALKRVAENVRDIQDKTRAVLEQNVQYRDVEERFQRSHETVRWLVRDMDQAQQKLDAELRSLRDPGALHPELMARLNALKTARGSWYLPADTGGEAAALVVPKRDIGRFIDQIFAGLLSRQPSTRDLAGLRADLLNDPRGLSALIPDAQVIDFGDADGFYIVYQTQFSVPHGMETATSATFGNVARLWGNNISVSGYQFVSPPNEENAPWGDKGVEVQVESLQGKNWVNYLNVDFHRFIQDIPPDMKMASSARQSRLLVFDDFAMLLFGDRLYVGAAGFADFALQDAAAKPSFYGGSLKTSVKFTEVMRLNAEQQEVFAKDPRSFMQSVNLDFTGLDPDLNRTFVIDAKGENKHYLRRQIGPSFDLARLIDSPDAFTVDFYAARQEGTDDYTQNSAGVTVLKGFTIKDEQGKPWMILQNKATAEKGTQYDTYSDRVSVTLPNQGIALSAEGRIIGDAKTYFLEASKTLGTHSNFAASYGSRYVGIPNRLTLSLNSSFTLGELWRSVSEGSADALQGSAALKRFNDDLDGLLSSKDGDEAVLGELKRIFAQDVGRRLLTQDVGTLTREIRELRQAGAFLDNTRIRGMVGFVTNPVGDSMSDRAAGGGFVAGTQTELTLTKTQKALIESKAETLYREGLRLQERLVGLTKQWQQAVLDIAQAQWELKLARAQAEKGQTASLRAEGRAWEAEAQGRLNAAAIRYNLLTGRAEGETLPFGDLGAVELEKVTAEIQRTLSSNDRLSAVLQGLDRKALEAELGGERFNLIDWIPWVDRLTFSFGAQLQDMMSNQVLGIGGGVRLPIYDPGSKEKDSAYRLEAQAVLAEARGVYDEFRLRAEKEALQSDAAAEEARLLAPQTGAAWRELSEALAGRRNGLVGDARLREAFQRWRDVTAGLLSAQGRAAVAAAWSELDGDLARPAAQVGDVSLGSFQEAFDLAARNSSGLEEIGYRQASAAAMARANGHRVQKFWLDVYAGWNLTSTGVGWIPSIGITGVGITPIPTFELKPEELQSLQVRQGEGKSREYQAFKTKLEADLAVEVFRAATQLSASRRAADILEREVLPAAKTQAEADGAKRRLIAARLGADQAEAALNYLLGREGAVAWTMAPDKALADLKVILAGKDPVAADKAVLASRVEVARAVETMADKGLKVEELRIEPVSLVVRSLGRLVHALSDEGIGNPDLVAAARIQTLEAERAEEAYDGDAAARRSAASTELSQARRRLADLAGKSDPESRLAVLGLEAQALALEATLARLGAEAEPLQSAEAPLSFTELSERLAEGRQALSAASRRAEPALFEPETLRHASQMGARYFDVRTDIGGSPVNKSFLESWVEVRLRSQDTPSEVLLALAKLRTDKADRAYRTDMAAARAEARILLSQFETDVRLLRWARAQGERQPQGRDFHRFMRELEARVEARGAEIKALIGMPSDASVESLVRLVPAEAAGAETPERIAGRLIAQARDEALSQFAQTVFEGGLPSLGGEDALAQQIKADVIAERMSYKGFTPVGAFGVFRGVGVGGAFLEAPDPRSIERSLESILSDSLRRELVSQGRMQELTLKLHLLMRSVSDKAVLLERQAQAAQAAQEDLRIAALRQAQGLAGAEDVLAAENALVSAWTSFTRTAAEAKNDFTALVAELEALGFDSRNVLQPTARPLELSGAEGRAPEKKVLEHLSRRLLDADFASRLSAQLRALGASDEDAAGLEDLARDYRQMAQDAGLVRRADLPAAQKLGLLLKADVEGRRQTLEGALGKLWIAAGPKGREGLLVFLREENRSDIAAAGAQRAELEATLEAMREAYASKAELPFAVRGAAQRLQALRRERDAARQTLLEDYLADLRGPGEFLLRDLALDRYLQAVTAYDEAVVRLFDSKDVREDAGLALRLDALFGLREALARQKALAERGRGLLALDSLLMLEDARLAALQWRRGAASEYDEVLASKERLTRLRERWVSGDIQGLQPLYAATRTDASGRRLWTAEGWHTQEDVDKLVAGGQAARDAEGRLWLTDEKGGKIELLAGVDAAEARRAAAQRGLDGAQGRAKVYDALSSGEFALVSLDGTQARPLSYEEVSKLASLFTFAAQADPRGLRPALHPLRALWSDPAAVETFAYLGQEPLSRDRFPTFESLQAWLERNPAEAAQFFRLEAGPAGVKRMLEAAQEQKLRQARAGWMGVKLQSYGFATDKNGAVASLYMTKGDFDEAVSAYREAGRVLPKTVERLKAAQAKAADAADAAQRQRALSDGENLRYQLVEREARERLSAQTQTSLSPKPGESEDAFAARVKAETDRRLVQDSDFKDAQKRLSEQLGRTGKLEQAKLDARREAAEALEDVKDAAKLVSAAGLWKELGSAAMAALKEGGLDESELSAFQAALERSGEFTLYVTRETALLVDEGRTLVGVSAEPALGKRRLEDRFGRAQGALTVVKGEVFAAVMDRDQTLVKLFMDGEVVEDAAKAWKLESVSGVRFENGRSVDPHLRLLHYVDPESGLPVMLNRRYLISRVEKAGERLTEAENWGVMPWNWGNLLLEIPKGVLRTPSELLTGRDPRQQGYLGRVYLRKIEGGATEHHGFFRKVAGAVDVLDILPDPVSWYFDQSQFPKAVDLDSALKPGENLYDKTLRAGDQDVLYGKGSIVRGRDSNVEDLLNARKRVLSFFEGGVEETWLETRRGRADRYQTSRIEEKPGADQLDRALDDPAAAFDGRGEARLSGEPGHLEVDRVERRLKIRTGARQYGSIEEGLSGLPARIERNRTASAGDAARYQGELDSAAADLRDAMAARGALEQRLAPVRDEAHALAWRIGRQDALEAEMRRLEADVVRLEAELAREREHLRALEEELANLPKPDPAQPADPSNPDQPQNPVQPHLPVFALWAVLALAFAAAVAAWWILRRRKPESR